MIVVISLLSVSALPWLIKSLESIDSCTNGLGEFILVLLKLVGSMRIQDSIFFILIAPSKELLSSKTKANVATPATHEAGIGL